jgi:hypothetical protein
MLWTGQVIVKPQEMRWLAYFIREVAAGPHYYPAQFTFRMMPLMS